MIFQFYKEKRIFTDPKETVPPIVGYIVVIQLFDYYYAEQVKIELYNYKYKILFIMRSIPAFYRAFKKAFYELKT